MVMGPVNFDVGDVEAGRKWVEEEYFYGTRSNIDSKEVSGLSDCSRTSNGDASSFFRHI